MAKLNLLQKLAPTGIAALSVITATAGSMLLAPSVQAQGVLCFSGTVEALGALGSVQCVDKLFDNFSITPALPQVPGLMAEITLLPSGNFSFNVEQEPFGVSGPFDRTISYDITITDPDYFFDKVGFDTDVDQIAGNVEAFKNLEILDIFSPEVKNSVAVGDTLSLVSINGSADSGSIRGATKIRVNDVLDAGVNATVFSVTNTYTQDINVPEPSAMLGLVALGGLGFGLKRKKQS